MREKTQLKFYWENPPHPDPLKRKGTICLWTASGRIYERKVSGKSLLNPAEAAKVLRVSRMHIHKLIKLGLLKAQKRGNFFAIRLIDLLNYDATKRPHGRPKTKIPYLEG